MHLQKNKKFASNLTFLCIQPLSNLSFATGLYHVNSPRSAREEHVIKEPCGWSGIMGYVTFHHKTGSSLPIVSCFFYMRNYRRHVSHNWGNDSSTILTYCKVNIIKKEFSWITFTKEVKVPILNHAYKWRSPTSKIYFFPKMSPF